MMDRGVCRSSDGGRHICTPPVSSPYEHLLLVSASVLGDNYKRAGRSAAAVITLLYIGNSFWRGTRTKLTQKTEIHYKILLPPGYVT